VKEAFKAEEGFSLTYLPFISRAVVDALHDFPHLNASISGTDLIVHRFVDLGIAVDLEGQGLLVPVVRSAEGKRMRAIAREISDLASRAKSRKLSPDEISGGTFTITNNGSAGSVLTMAIINQPQVAILSTDAVVRKPVVVNIPGGGESIAIHPVGHLAMSWDHRAFDGAYAAGFLVRVKEILETRDWSPCCAFAGSGASHTARRWSCKPRSSTTGPNRIYCSSSIRTCSPTARGPRSTRT